MMLAPSILAVREPMAKTQTMVDTLISTAVAIKSTQQKLWRDASAARQEQHRSIRFIHGVWHHAEGAKDRGEGRPRGKGQWGVKEMTQGEVLPLGPLNKHGPQLPVPSNYPRGRVSRFEGQKLGRKRAELHCATPAAAGRAIGSRRVDRRPMWGRQGGDMVEEPSGGGQGRGRAQTSLRGRCGRAVHKEFREGEARGSMECRHRVGIGGQPGRPARRSLKGSH